MKRVASSGVSLLALSLALAPGLFALQTESSLPPPDLAGRWKLNAGASDDARQKMREERDKRGDRGRMGSGGAPMGPPGSGESEGSAGPHGPGGPGGGGPGGGGRPGGREPGDTMRAVFEPPEELSITQTPAEVAVEALYGDLRVFRPNGKKSKAENGTVERVAEWKAGTLVVETKNRLGQKIRETWSLADAGKRLTIDVKIDAPVGPGLSLVRVYDRLASAE